MKNLYICLAILANGALFVGLFVALMRAANKDMER